MGMTTMSLMMRIIKMMVMRTTLRARKMGMRRMTERMTERGIVRMLGTSGWVVFFYIVLYSQVSLQCFLIPQHVHCNNHATSHSNLHYCSTLQSSCNASKHCKYPDVSEHCNSCPNGHCNTYLFPFPSIDFTSIYSHPLQYIQSASTFARILPFGARIGHDAPVRIHEHIFAAVASLINPPMELQWSRIKPICYCWPDNFQHGHPSKLLGNGNSFRSWLPPFPPAGSPQSRNNLPSLPPAPSTNDNSLSDTFTQHLQLFAYTGPGSTPNCSQLSSIMQNSEDPEGTTLGKCKPVPSLCAKRDNMIDNTDKENSLPSLERGKKLKGKRPAASDTNMSTSGPIRKPK